MLKIVSVCAVVCAILIAVVVINGAPVGQNNALKSIATNYGSGLAGFKAIIDRLVVRNAAGTTEAQQTAWAEQLQTDVVAMHGSFESASDQLGVENGRLGVVVGDLTATTSALEKQVGEHQKAVAVAQTVVTQKNNEVTANQQRVASAEANLASMQRALNNANDKYRDARESCLHRRRKRGWNPFKKIKKVIKKITRPVEKVIRKVTKPIEKAICKTLNSLTHQIDRARRNRDGATNARNQAINRLATSKQQRTAAQQQLAGSQASLRQKQEQTAATERRRAASQRQLMTNAELEESVKQVLEHLDRVTVGSGQLKAFVADLELLLVFVDALLVPLNHMSAQLTAQHIPGVVLISIPQLSVDQKAQIIANLQQLKETLED